MSYRPLTIVLAIILSACAGLSGLPATTATVTGITTGRASVPAERVYVLRTAEGRVYLTTQILDKPPKVGDEVIIEPGGNGGMRIKGSAK